MNPNRIIYKKGNLFDAAGGPNSILAHAVNCKGVWGSGIATEFKRLFPSSFEDYYQLCNRHKKQLLGMGVLYVPSPNNEASQQKIAYLFTSYGYGPHKDPESRIVKNTDRAIGCLFSVLKDEAEIHSPKINAGKFAVPWEKTAAVIEKHLKLRKIKWTVWELPNVSGT